MSDCLKETQIYPPIKKFLEERGYEVKSEIGALDVMAVREGDSEPLIVELKTGFSLSLFHQAIARLTISDLVYIAVPHQKGQAWYRRLKSNVTLCKRLGLGLLTVRLKDELVQIHCEPVPYAPRKSKARRTSVLSEFARRSGDPNIGGATRSGLITAYRQDAIKLAQYLRIHGPSKGALVRDNTGVSVATRMMRDNHYGWFERHNVGVYGLSERGKEATQPIDLGKF